MFQKKKYMRNCWKVAYINKFKRHKFNTLESCYTILSAHYATNG